MRPVQWTAILLLLSVAMFGCTKSDSSGPQAAATSGPSPADAQTSAANLPSSAPKDLEPPAQAVFEFLSAVRAGDDAKATAMLSSVARTKAAELNRTVRPSASDTAKFQIGAIQYIGEDGARVASLWTDIDDAGQAQTDEALWVLRHEADGWRIAGVAATIFEGEPPLLLNFEDPEEMSQKQQWVRDEIRRRAEAEVQQPQQQLQAKTPDTEDAVRR